ncbi:MAG: flagellar hook-basal body protein [Candidatus Rokubacteria bacterium]|nr:flagellar hook-basal body protein [Candidatus Rokubacteria bacterium]
MVTGLYTAAWGMDAQTERISVLANNLANLATAGFKADHPEFSQLLTPSTTAGPVPPAGPAGPPSPLPLAMRTVTDHSQGILRATGNPLDLAISGPGFFVLDTPGGPRLTRAGNFTRSPEGLLVAADGAPVRGVSGNIQVLDGTVTIDRDGQVLVDGRSQGHLLVVTPSRLASLTKTSGTRFTPPDTEALVASATAVVHQGAIEMSNVNPVLTLVTLIDAMRTYEAAQRAARSADDTLARAANDLGRV